MNLLAKLKYVSVVGAAIPSFIPALSYLTNDAPPLFPGFGAVATALASAGVFVVLLFRFRRSKKKTGLPASVRAAVYAWCAAVALVIGYYVLLEWTSVRPPRPGTLRIQIGFGTALWSLTSETQAWLAAQEHRQSTEDLMLRLGGYEPGGVSTIWKDWTILLAGSLLAVVFVSAGVVWAIGWALIARSIPQDEAPNTEKMAPNTKAESEKK